jgi:antirestriction protein ArdC
MSTEKADLYSRVASRIIAELEQGVRPWFKPWNAEHASGRVTRPLRANGQPYRGINVLCSGARLSPAALRVRSG